MRNIKLYIILLLPLLLACCKPEQKREADPGVSGQIPDKSGVSIVVLGNVQDAGSPHIACDKDCCKQLFNSQMPSRKVTCLGLVDHASGKTFLFEATPDISTQLKNLKSIAGTANEIPDGIFLTHAHIGHYTGLMYLGREAVNAKDIPVYAMPRLKTFLETNGPWEQLVTLENISLNELRADSVIQLTEKLRVTPFLVPHRDEYSETVGYRIDGPQRSAVFIPDIDKWKLWDRSITDLVRSVDYAFLDATFYSGEELNNRDISEIPHPFIIESMELFGKLSAEDKSKVYFIHFNHTNPVLDPASEATMKVEQAGHNIARTDDIFKI